MSRVVRQDSTSVPPQPRHASLMGSGPRIMSGSFAMLAAMSPGTAPLARRSDLR